MKKEKTQKLILSLIIISSLLHTSCSTKKNTWATRNYHALTTHYNINYNGERSYSEGIRNIEMAQVDDFSHIIPLFPISNHANASAASGQMTVAIEKGRKAIKRHSIKKKPKKNLRKARNQKYKNFYAQKEFNPALQEAWLLIGKAEFHQAEFLGSIGTFSYITKEYATNKEMIIEAQLWMARAYTELDWLYEAEQALANIDQNDLKQSLIGLFAETNACLLLKKGEYKEAIPFVELALAREKYKNQKKRTAYLLAQLYQYVGDKQSAEKAYANAIKKNPPYKMKFNALLNLSLLKGENQSSTARKDLLKMSKKTNNKDFLDQIYFAIGKIDLQEKDSVKAIENYNLAISSSTRNGIEKANVLIALADLHYQRKEYLKAEEAYKEASTIVTTEHKEYKRIVLLSEVLSELNTQQEIVVLQDSLLHLSTLPESEQRKIAEQIIAETEKQESETQKREEEERWRKENFDEMDDEFSSQDMFPDRMNSGKWYFYNPSTVAGGKTAFRKNWGNRKLEDNWRRSNKAGALFADNTQKLQEQSEDQRESNESELEKTKISDNRNPDYYLQQIPKTATEIQSSKTQIANALVELGIIFKDKISDFHEARIVYKDFIHRFEKDERVPEAYFQLFLIESREKNLAASKGYREELLRNYPESKQAKLLQDSNYIENFYRRMTEENALYQQTYTAYSQSDFKTVNANYQLAKTKFPLSKLTPKFAFLDALASGKSGSSDQLQVKLEELITEYPDSEVSAMAKDIAALIKQGREVQSGTTHGSLLSKRDFENTDEGTEDTAGRQQFSSSGEGSHRLLFVSPKEEQDLYQLLYEIASFNFTSFMIKEFDLQLGKFDRQKNAITLTNFNSYKEVEWYLNAITKNHSLANMLAKVETQNIIISDENYNLARRIGFDAYIDFQKKHNFSTSTTAVVTPTEKREIAKKQDNKALQDESKKEQKAEAKENKQIKKEESIAVTEAKEHRSQESDKKEKKQIDVPAVENEPTKIEEKEEELELYKGLFAIQEDKPHFVAIYILNGKMDFEKFKTKLDDYNAQNYNMLNIEVSLKNLERRRSMIIVGEFQNAEIAKSYLMRIIKEKEIFDNLRGSNYRNLLGTQRNLNIMLKEDALSTYNAFMKEFYLK